MRAISLGLAILAVSVAVSTALATPEGLTITVVNGEVQLGWYPAEDAQTMLLRRLNAPVAGPYDLAAEVLTSGASTQFAHPIVDLLPDMAGAPHVYHYAVYGCDESSICETTGSHATLAPSFVQCLRGGGYTIFWRHADANVCIDHTELGTAANTTVPNWWRSCASDCPTATARQVNADGVQHATYIGDQIRAQGIPIGRVISSEFCRCIQTAELMAFGLPIETDQGITFFVYDEANRCAHCFERVQEMPPAGANTAIIGHSVSPCTPMNELTWSECAVFKPNGAGGSTLITKLTWDAWGAMTTAVTPSPVVSPGVTLDVPREVAGTLRIRYRILSDQPEPIRLEVFDISGRRLWSVHPGSQGRGEYEYSYRTDDVSAGIYLVRLQAGPAAVSRKSLILRR